MSYLTQNINCPTNFPHISTGNNYSVLFDPMHCLINTLYIKPLASYLVVLFGRIVQGTFVVCKSSLFDPNYLIHCLIT